MKYVLILVLLISTQSNAASIDFSKEFIDHAIGVCKPNKGLKRIRWVDSIFYGKVVIHCNNGMVMIY